MAHSSRTIIIKNCINILHHDAPGRRTQTTQRRIRRIVRTGHFPAPKRQDRTAGFSTRTWRAKSIPNEKRVNALELKIDKDCENIFALFNPVAIDLRFVLAVLKINSNLERIGDIADGIARYVIEADAPFHGDLLKVTRLTRMYTLAIESWRMYGNASIEEDTRLARGVFKKDDVLDDINGAPTVSWKPFLIRKEAGTHCSCPSHHLHYSKARTWGPGQEHC